jgi:hypothetical protein
MSTAFPKHRPALLTVAMILAALGLAVYASAAQAACSYPDAAQVFAPWKDKGWYQLAPEGGLEGGGNGWTFEGGATLVADPEDRNHDGVQEDTAVRLPFGASATSPPVCVDETTPNFRVMLRNFGDKDAKLRVRVTYEGTAEPVKARDTDVRAEREDEWVPSRSLKLETKKEERVARITFTSQDPEGEYLVDDLYVDPFARY